MSTGWTSDVTLPVAPLGDEARRMKIKDDMPSRRQDDRSGQVGRQDRAAEAENAVACVAQVLDTMLALASAVVGLLLVAGSQILAPGACGALVLTASTIRTAIAVDHWLQKSSRCGSKAAGPPDVILEERQVSRDHVDDDQREVPYVPRYIASQSDAKEEDTYVHRLAADLAAERFQKAEAMTARLVRAEAECGDLAMQLDSALHRLSIRGDEEQRLRKVSRIGSARTLRLAARLVRFQHLRSNEVCARLARSNLSFASQAPHGLRRQEDGTLATSSLDGHVKTDSIDEACLKPATCTVVISEAPDLSQRLLAHQGFVGTDRSENIEERELCGEVTSHLTNSISKEMEAVSTLPKKDMIARITQMAAKSSEVRESLREKLQAARRGVGMSAELVVTNDQLEKNYIEEVGVVVEVAKSDKITQDDPILVATADATKMRSEIMTRLSNLAAANESLRMELGYRNDSLTDATRNAASLQKVVADQATEISRLKAHSDALEVRAAKVAAELRASRQLLSAREVFQSTDGGPELTLQWADASWSWPGGNGSSKGTDKLRRNMSGRSTKLSIGPPPVDWRTLLQLGLRRGQPSDPAVLRLVVPNAEEGVYVGLLWEAAQL